MPFHPDPNISGTYRYLYDTVFFIYLYELVILVYLLKTDDANHYE